MTLKFQLDRLHQKLIKNSYCNSSIFFIMNMIFFSGDRPTLNKMSAPISKLSIEQISPCPKNLISIFTMKKKVPSLSFHLFMSLYLYSICLSVSQSVLSDSILSLFYLSFCRNIGLSVYLLKSVSISIFPFCHRGNDVTVVRKRIKEEKN